MARRQFNPMERSVSNVVPSDIKDPSLATRGQQRIEWAEQDMPVLRLVRARSLFYLASLAGAAAAGMRG